MALWVAVGCVPTAATEPLQIDNGTTLAVTVVVNGQVVRDVGPSIGPIEISPAILPAPPWSVEVRSPSGRVLLDLTVRPQDVMRTTGPSGLVALKGAAARVDLSCGRLDVWVGPPLAGPPPEPGTPGDCAP